MEKSEIQNKIKELEAQMANPRFWEDKVRAQVIIKEVQRLKDELEGVGKYDKGDAVMTIFSGAGGDDAEDFSAILLKMYLKYFEHSNFGYKFLHENQNDHGGYRNVTIEIVGKGAYGILKNESGVHRLVRISPFNANQKRHTSFSMVEVIPKFAKQDENEIEIEGDDLKIEFSRSSGPGGQNVNKRETAVRIVHLPTNLSAQSDGERTQEANKEKALAILKAKIFKALEEERISKEKGMYISKTTSVEWGNQIRSYVLHPYKMVKDHRTLVETSDVEGVLEQGKIEIFLEAEKNL
ncbi:MAG: PCRF domain-containing protein [Patescibacteria group bacterium]